MLPGAFAFTHLVSFIHHRGLGILLANWRHHRIVVQVLQVNITTERALGYGDIQLRRRCQRRVSFRALISDLAPETETDAPLDTWTSEPGGAEELRTKMTGLRIVSFALHFTCICLPMCGTTII
jgi:hypothetical protein